MFGRKKKKQIREENQRKAEIKRNFELSYEWKEISKEEWDNIFKDEKKIKRTQLESRIYAIFKKKASELGFCYNEVEEVFKQQNTQFFNDLKSFFDYKNETIEVNKIAQFKKLLILPYQNDIQEIVAKIRRLSPKEQAELLQEYVNKKIRVIVEDE